MKTRNWGLGILAVGAVLAISAGTLAPHGGPVPDTSAFGEDQSPVAPAASARPGIVGDVLSLLQEPRAVFEARMKVSSQCMAAAGFPDFARGGQADRLDDMSASLHGFPTLSLEGARTNGYRGREEPAFSPAADPSGELKAYLGFDPMNAPSQSDLTKGCRGTGYLSVYGDANASGEFGRVLGALQPAVHSAKQDNGLKSALGDWSACMTEAGYPALTDPAKAASLSSNFVGADGKEGAGPEARKIAIADVTCRGKTSLVSRMDAVLARYLTTAVDKLGPELAPARALRKESAARVASPAK